MSCILRAWGADFDIDDFMAKASFEVDSFWRKGEKRFTKSENSETNQSSGIRVVASEADFSELTEQIQDVISFLRKNLEQVKCLATFPGVEGVVLDFGAEIYPPGWASFTFPPELLLLAGEARVSLCLSVYPTINDEQSTT
ncbi:MAG: hypothetical protein OEY28_01770 [Nitrospira sp.]|nr:hypothetical protein [Nitrospira sp.]